MSLWHNYDWTIDYFLISVSSGEDCLHADQISDLTGRQLVEQKVSSVFIMGGVYPATDIFSEFNFNCGEFLLGDLAECEGSAKAAVENMPPSVKMVFSGFEAELHTAD